MMLWILVVVFLILWTIISRWKNRKMMALAKQLGTRSIALPVVGHAYRFLGNNEDRMNTFKSLGRESYEKGGLIAQWQGNRLFILVADPEPAEVLLKTCLEKDDIFNLIRYLLGNGSISAPVSIWRPRRKVLAPIFSLKNLNSFVKVFSRQSSILVNQLRPVAGTGTFSVWKYITTYAMNSVCETTLGIEMNANLQPAQAFLNAFENYCRLEAKRVCQPWLYNETLYRLFSTDAFELRAYSKEVIWNFMDKVITSKWAALKNERLLSKPDPTHKDSIRSFLELLIDSSGGDKGYSNVELREETLVIVLAGTDTSAVGICFTTVLLAKYQDVQEKVYQELREVFGDSERPVTPEDLPRLKYLEVVIKESLRLYPPVPFIVRQAQQDVILPSGITILKGCGIFISIWAIHRNPRYWGDDAEQFRPERFIDTPLKHPAAFMPFSHGPRSCPGYQYAIMSMKTALATLLRRYRVLPSEGNDVNYARSGTSELKSDPSELRVQFNIMLKDVNDFVVKLDLRT